MLEVGVASAVALALVRRRVASGTVVVAAIIASGVGFALTELVLRQFAHLSLYAVVLEELRARSSELLQTVKQNPAAARESLEMLKHITTAIIDRFVTLARYVHFHHLGFHNIASFNGFARVFNKRV